MFSDFESFQISPFTTNGVLDDPDKANVNVEIALFINANGDVVNETFKKLNIETLGPTSDDFDLNAYIPIKRPIYFYIGSDTKPPCFEDHNYIISTDIMLVPEKSVNKIIDWIVTNSGGDNKRKTYPLYDRTIYYQTYSDPIIDDPEPEFDNTHFLNPASPIQAKETFTGPISWATEDKNIWTGACLQGKEQSPIDLSKETSKYNQKQIGYIISTHYNLNKYNLAIQDNRRWYTDMTGGGFSLIHFKNVQYKFNVLEFSFHCNSEHTIDGKHSDLEIQIKHKKDANYLRERGWRLDPNSQRDVIIISIRFKVGTDENSNFSKINIKNRGPTLDGFDLNKFIDTSGSFYFYKGSSTLPPCVEDSYWVIMEETFTISQRQLDEVKSWIKPTTNEMNARSVKKLNNRIVYYTKDPNNLITEIEKSGRSSASSNKLIHRLIISLSLMFLVL